MATKRVRRSLAALYLLIDLVVVFLFIFAGRDTRGVSFVEDLAEAWPFFLGVGIGWLAGRVWRNPRGVLWTGIVVWASTVVIGLTVRSLLGQPTDSRFVFITFIALGVFFLGWRGVAWILDALFGRAIEKPVDEKYRR